MGTGFFGTLIPHACPSPIDEDSLGIKRPLREFDVAQAEEWIDCSYGDNVCTLNPCAPLTAPLLAVVLSVPEKLFPI